MVSIDELWKEVNIIKDRNSRVEIDKKWETSLTRKFLLIVFTYLSIGVYLNVIDIPNPWMNAIVPALAFLLSTLTLPFFKNLWQKHIRKNS